MEFKKGVAYTGLCDVWGGKMWFCITHKSDETRYFWTKKECEKFIRCSFSGSDKKHMLSKLKNRHGRAVCYGLS